jgi:heme exporter protein A
MLIVNKVSFGFPHRPILSHFELTVHRGELVHITGPNGAGKSTLMALIAGLIPLDKGEIKYLDPQGVEVEDRRLCMEYVPAEANGLFAKMNALQNLRFWSALRFQKTSTQQLIEELQFWGLGHPLILDAFPVDKYSTGMKRRLALARLTLAKTECWLLDEPVYGLDAAATETFRQVLARHLKEGGLAVIISHDLAALKDLSYRRLDLGTLPVGAKI